METFLSGFDVALSLVYFFLFLFYLKVFFSNHAPYSRLFLMALPVALAIHFIKLFLQGMHEGHCPIASIGDTFSFTAFSLGLIYLIIERRKKYYSTGAIFVFILLLFQSVTLIAASGTIQNPELKGIPYGFHAPLALIGVAAFTASAMYGVFYLLMFHQLKSKHLSSNLKKLPPLERVEWMQTISCVIGTIFFSAALTAGLILGSFYNKISIGDPKILISIVVLGVFAYCTIGANFFAFSGTKKSVIAVTGFLIAVISMTVVRLCLPTFHHF